MDYQLIQLYLRTRLSSASGPAPFAVPGAFTVFHGGPLDARSVGCVPPHRRRGPSPARSAGRVARVPLLSPIVYMILISKEDCRYYNGVLSTAP